MASGTFRIDFSSSDVLSVTFRNDYEFLVAPFRIARGVILPNGSYSFNDAAIAYTVKSRRARSSSFVPASTSGRAAGAA